MTHGHLFLNVPTLTRCIAHASPLLFLGECFIVFKAMSCPIMFYVLNRYQETVSEFDELALITNVVVVLDVTHKVRFVVPVTST